VLLARDDVAFYFRQFGDRSRLHRHAPAMRHIKRSPGWNASRGFRLLVLRSCLIGAQSRTVAPV
jgi:hypothetical protein